MPTTSGFPIEFAVTPRFDLFYSLFTLSGGAGTKLSAWKERALIRLPRDFDRAAKRVAPVPLFWPLLADALQAVPGELSFEEILTGLRSLSGEELRESVLMGIFHERNVVDSLLQRRKTLRQVLADDTPEGGSLLAAFGLLPFTSGSRAANAISSLIADPESYRDQLIMVLQRFWQTGFRRDWTALEPQLRSAAFRMKGMYERGSIGALFSALNLPVSVDEKNGTLLTKTTRVAEFDRIDRCYIIPSAFNVGRWWARYQSRTGRARLYFPVMTAEVSANEVPGTETVEPRKTASNEPVNAELVFRALGDTTRYAIASILAHDATTSADLARRLDVSKPTITHHIQALRSAGLIVSDAQGGAVKLSLNAETIRRVSDAAVEQLFSGPADRELATTRKRRK